MAVSITITIQDNAKAARIGDALAARHGYTGLKPNGTAETKMEFVQRITIRQWRQEVIAYEESISNTTFETNKRNAALTIATDIEGIIIT